MFNYVKRYVILSVGLFIMALGIALSTKANLGVSPVSSVPYVLSLVLPWSMGTLTVAMHVVFILIQMALLRRDYRIVQLLQLAVAFVFGFFTDAALWLCRDLNVTSYLSQWVLCLASCVIIAFGVLLEVKAGVVMLAGEGVMLAIARVFRREFHKVKVGFDLSQIVLALVVSLLCLGALVGVREGTVVAAILVGLLVRRFEKWCAPLLRRLGIAD